MKSLIVILGIILSYNSFSQMTLRDTSGIFTYYISEPKYDTIQAIGVKYNWNFDSPIWVGGWSYGYDSPQVFYTPMRVVVKVTKYGNIPVKYFKQKFKDSGYLIGAGATTAPLDEKKYEWVEFKPKFDQIIYQNE